MSAILIFLNAHNLPVFQPILMIFVSKSMVYRVLSDKTYYVPFKHSNKESPNKKLAVFYAIGTALKRKKLLPQGSSTVSVGLGAVFLVW